MPDSARSPANQAPQDLPPGVKLRNTLEGHMRKVASLAFSPGGRKLASGGRDAKVMLWDIRSARLLRTLEGHQNAVHGVAFDSAGRTLASCGGDKMIHLWDANTGAFLRSFTSAEKNINGFSSVAFEPQGPLIVSGTYGLAPKGNVVEVRRVLDGELLRNLKAHSNYVGSVAFDHQGRTLASGSCDHTIGLWDRASGKLLHILESHEDDVLSVVFNCMGNTLASASSDKTVRLWDVASGKLLRTLEGHTGKVHAVAFSDNGALLASKSEDQTVRLWRCDTWELVAVILEPTLPSVTWWESSLAFSPTEPLLVTGGSAPGTPEEERGRVIHLWELDYDVLLRRQTTPVNLLAHSVGGIRARVNSFASIHHTTARIVLVGDSGVGKTGLGWRLAHGHFKEHASTHGQQFWVCDALGTKRTDGTDCEAVIWDLAGQPDYRLIHSLFLDDADLALVLFDPTHASDPLHGVEFWLKQLKVGQTCSLSGAEGAAATTQDGERNDEGQTDTPGASSRMEKEESAGLRGDRLKVCPTLLVAARCDRGDARLTEEELEAFCRARGIAGYVRTSAQGNIGIEELLAKMKPLLAWDDKPATTTSATFKRIKDYVLGLKETSTDKRVIVSAEQLRALLEATDAAWRFTDAEMLTAVGHLETYGYVRRLRTSRGERRILLAPELLNNLAASFVLEARRNQRGLGALEERRLWGDGERYLFPELATLAGEEQTILTDAAALLFIEHHICFRETDPLTGQAFLIFPELINLKRPIDDDKAPDEGAAYTVTGAVENVFASLVVLLGYTSTFTRIAHWQNNARYEVADGSVCGFRMRGDGDGCLDLTLCFSTAAPPRVRKLFEGLFESCLARRNLNVSRHEPIICGACKSRLDRDVARQQLSKGKTFTFCNDCGEKLSLAAAEPIQRTSEQHAEVEKQRQQADARTRFEQAIFRVSAFVTEQKIKPPQCFISYAWGEKEQEHWVEKALATDLQKAGIDVVLDRWENAKIGASVPRFVERIEKVDHVIVVGTPDYRRKYDNKDTTTGYVVAAEVDMLNNRLLGTETQKESVMPTLLAGEKTKSLPPMLHSRVYADFRQTDSYFITAFHLILSLYDLKPNHPAVADLVESLQGNGLRM